MFFRKHRDIFYFFVQKIGKFVQIFQHLSAGIQSHIQVKFFCQPNIRRTIHVAFQLHDQMLRCTCTDLPPKSQQYPFGHSIRLCMYQCFTVRIQMFTSCQRNKVVWIITEKVPSSASNLSTAASNSPKVRPPVWRATFLRASGQCTFSTK